MTSDRIASISDVIADEIRALRKREGMARDELAKAAQAAGAPGTFTAVALGNIETGRRDATGRRRREVSVDELVALAAATGRSPLALLGGFAELFGATPTECQRCAGNRGDLERTVRADVADLAELDGVEATLAQTAYVLAAAIDDGGGEGGKQLPQLAKELRATVDLIMAGRRGIEPPDEDDELDDLGEPD